MSLLQMWLLYRMSEVPALWSLLLLCEREAGGNMSPVLFSCYILLLCSSNNDLSQVACSSRTCLELQKQNLVGVLQAKMGKAPQQNEGSLNRSGLKLG